MKMRLETRLIKSITKGLPISKAIKRVIFIAFIIGFVVFNFHFRINQKLPSIKITNGKDSIDNSVLEINNQQKNDAKDAVPPEENKIKDSSNPSSPKIPKPLKEILYRFGEANKVDGKENSAVKEDTERESKIIYDKSEYESIDNSPIIHQFNGRALLESKKKIILQKNYPSKAVQRALLFVLSNYNPQKELIPTLIHQQYGKPLTGTALKNVNKFRNSNSGFLHILWTNEDLEIFVKEFHPDIYKMYTALPLKVLQSDVARYLLLLTFGGYYSDVDTVQLRPLATWADGKNLEVGLMVGIEVDTERADWRKWYPRSLQFCQWTLASRPGHPMLLNLKQRILSKLTNLKIDEISVDDVVHVTGPAPFTDSLIDVLKLKDEDIKELRNLQSPVLKDDTYILPITAFSPGVGHMGAKPISDKQALVQHLFGGEWKKQ